MQDHRRQVIYEKYPRMASGLLRPFVDVLSRARNACGGDIDKFLVLLVVAVRTTEHPDFQAFSHDELLSGDVPVFPSLGTNSRSIAASTGIPKETARRKVVELVEAGWLVRQGRDLRFTARAYQEMAPTREGLERLALAYWELVSAVLEPAEGGAHHRG